MDDWNRNCVPIPNFVFLPTLNIATRLSILKLGPDHVTLLSIQQSPLAFQLCDLDVCA